MRILIDLTSLADNFSGIERYAAYLSRELVVGEQNKYILLFKEEIHPLFAELQGKENIEFVVIPKCKKIIFNQIRLPLEIYRHKADWYLFLAFPVPVFLFKKNMISTIHDICCWDCPETMNGLSHWYFRISHKVALRKCRAIITISEFSKQRIIDRLKYPQEKLWLIYCGIDEKFVSFEYNAEASERVREKYDLPEKYWLSLSTLEPRKNLRLLVNAYGQLVKEGKADLPLVLAGRKGWKMEQLLAGIDGDVLDRIKFTGFIDEEDLPVVYGNSALFIFPSLYEGFGMPPLEAMACGCRVLSSDAASLPEILGDAAVYFKSNDADDLMEKLSDVHYSEYDPAKNVMQAKNFNWKDEADKLLFNLEKNL